MGFFKASRGHKIDGHKHLSLNGGITTLPYRKKGKVYFPLFVNKPVERLVNVGDIVKVGQKIIMRTDQYVPIYSSVSGVVIENEKVYDVAIGREIDHLVIEDDGKYTLAQPLEIVGENPTKEEIVSKIKEAGIVGLGGAGFPTYRKYDNVLNRVLLVNGVECEPYLTTDYVSIKEGVDTLLKGIELLIIAAGASECYIAIKAHKVEIEKVLKEALANHPQIHLSIVKDLYPMGWERTLIKQIFNVTYNSIPSEVGIVVNNVQTVMAVAKALLEGRPLSKRIVTVSGEGVVSPQNVLINIGTLASEVIDFCGGLKEGNFCVLPGGPMTSKAAKSTSFPVSAIIGGITVVEEKVYRVEPCLRCGECIKHCPAGLMPVEIMDGTKRADIERLKQLQTQFCVECGLCSYVCPSRIEVKEFVAKAKSILRIEQLKQSARRK